MRTASTNLIEAISEAGVSYIFANLGSDHHGIIESLAEAKAIGRATPQLITCPNEMVALSAAHGYAQVSGRAGRPRSRRVRHTGARRGHS